MLLYQSFKLSWMIARGCVKDHEDIAPFLKKERNPPKIPTALRLAAHFGKKSPINPYKQGLK
jgi:hypothetical protein